MAFPNETFYVFPILPPPSPPRLPNKLPEEEEEEKNKEQECVCLCSLLHLARGTTSERKRRVKASKDREVDS
ncbi:hypothetical protein E2C01_046246 [Portunus trituberculatus]|uniref:Uncharacterized protein n=1 Tax=Portunus trituberculatus TaxID=210409 RepID=A0A5B7G5F8_PORTR|nr:hypothetical protein [Portunus trituberculatus]